jgi:hypothetical protein
MLTALGTSGSLDAAFGSAFRETHAEALGRG